jgi:hypothetical protein
MSNIISVTFSGHHLSIANAAGQELRKIVDGGPGDLDNIAGQITLDRQIGDYRWVRTFDASGKVLGNSIVDDNRLLPITNRTNRVTAQVTHTVGAEHGLPAAGATAGRLLIRNDQGAIVRDITDNRAATSLRNLVADEAKAQGQIRFTLPKGFNGTLEVIDPATDRTRSFRIINGKISSAPIAVTSFPPVKRLKPVSYYSDPARSIIDPAKYKAYRQAVDPLLDALAYFNGAANGGDSPAVQKARARQAIATLEKWAAGKSLEGGPSQIDSLLQMWGLTGIANAYARLRKIADTQGSPSDTLIRDWIVRLGQTVKKKFNPAPGAYLNEANIGAWFGASMASVSALLGTQDGTSVTGGLNVGKVADAVLVRQINAIKAEGSEAAKVAFFPDINRAGKAWYYGTFATEALLTIIQKRSQTAGWTLPGSTAPGMDEVWTRNNGALKTAVATLINGIADKRVFEKKTGKPQDPWDVQDLYWLHMLPNDLKSQYKVLQTSEATLPTLAQIPDFGRFQGGSVT